MPATFRASDVLINAVTTSVTPDVDALPGVADGDILIAVMTINADKRASMAVSAGWTLESNIFEGSFGGGTVLVTRIKDGANNPTISWTGNAAVGLIYAAVNGEGNGELNVQGPLSQVDFGDTTMVFLPSVSEADDCIVAICCGIDVVASTDPAGYTLDESTASGLGALKMWHLDAPGSPNSQPGNITGPHPFGGDTWTLTGHAAPVPVIPSADGGVICSV